MAEIETATPATPATPATTDTPAPPSEFASTPEDTGSYNPDAAIDAAIRERLESSGAEPDPNDDAPVQAATEPETPPAEIPPQEPETEDDALAKELGIDPAKNNRIPYAKVKKIIANTEKRLTEQHTKALTERDTQIQAHTDRLMKVDAVERIMETDPARFLKLLVDTNPAYAPLIGGNGHAAAPARVHGDDQEPPPDYDLGNGHWTYSVEGLKRRDAWRDRHTEARIFQRLDPILKRHEAEALIEAEGPRIRQQLQRLQARPKFMENLDAIHALVRQGHSADDAYWAIVGPQLLEDQNTMRARLLKEQQQLPKSTSVGVAATIPKADDPEATIDAQIKARLKAGAGYD